ncbi:endolytic transglycosylase MltG [Solicola gregarius]|uniref:Endolytic murein transglycosylase n=1 Tax=Solicola gregarius TaxID=2908642 RepID=A0AA46YKT3_9ACTN|nr:endolytic transglycosylase MltG [Solicola gregarius]UYM04826.1 endolytic transglycosylase MltG [Solicola gregarius]
MTDYEPEIGWHTAADTEAVQEGTTLPPDEAPRPAGHRRARKKKRRGPGCILALVIVVVLGAVGYWGVQKAASFLDDQFGPPPDYSGNGTGTVVVHVEQGAVGSEIGRTLKEEGVVASVDAYLDAADANPEAQSIQPGYYELAHKMSAEAALGRLLDADFRTQGSLVIPEGLRSDQVVAAIVDGTDLEEADVEKALKQTNALGLPGYADGDPEGFLYPASYDLPEKPTASGVLKTMVQKAKTEHRKLGLESKADKLGVSARDALIAASLVEREASRDQDRAKVARVIYNRLDEGMALQLDSTVHYVAERSGDVFTTDEEREIDSPYNTYENTGLPPGPIDSPGAEAIKAALNPADGDWTYFVTVDLESGETLFASSLDEHNKNVDKLQEYCEGSDLC